MDFELTDKQKELKQDALSFASQFNKDLVKADELGEFSYENWKKCAKFGLLGLQVSNEFGGQNRSLSESIPILEGFGSGCQDEGLCFAVNSTLWSVVEILNLFATTQQKQDYLLPVVQGKKIGAFAMTEAESGSDCFSLTTTARATDDSFILNGRKELITFAPIADFTIIFAKTNPDAGTWGVSAFIVDSNTLGYQASGVQSKMGLRTTPIGSIDLSECTIAQHQLLGKIGAGASMFNRAQEAERGCILASQLGAMERQLKDTAQFAKKRKQFGQPISKFQSVSNRIVQMKLRYEISRLLIYKTAWLRENKKPVMSDAALTNLYVAEQYIASSMDAIMIRGGRGYLTENEVERNLRDAIAAPLYGGTADIQRELVARLMGL